MKRHDIKILETYADAVLSGEKTFEIRENDRGYQKGDEVCFKVIDSKGVTVFAHELNGKVYTITYMLHGWGLKDNWCVFSIKPVVPLVTTCVCVPDTPLDYSSMHVTGQASNPTSVKAQLKVDPNTQCVDCPYRLLIDTPDGHGKSIKCGMYMTDDGEDIIRKPTDTCVANIVDMPQMTVKKEK